MRRLALSRPDCLLYAGPRGAILLTRATPIRSGSAVLLRRVPCKCPGRVAVERLRAIARRFGHREWAVAQRAGVVAGAVRDRLDADAEVRRARAPARAHGRRVPART